jgi:hypothetical protein
MDGFELRAYPGYHGAHTRAQFPGALDNGTRVRKVIRDEGDAHPVGSTGAILGSVGHPAVGVGYFIEWDRSPRLAVFCAGHKIEPLPETAATPERTADASRNSE